MGILSGKRILVTGLVDDRSLAYGIAHSLHKQGAELAFSYKASSSKERVIKLAQEFETDLVFQCDITDDQQIDDLFNNLSGQWNKFDGFIHSIAKAPISSFIGGYLESVTRKNFFMAHDASSYSLAGLTKSALPLLNSGSSIVTISYLGANRAVPGYNVMGVAKASLEANVRYLANDLGPRQIRVNAVSTGPFITKATARSPVIDENIKYYAKHSPLRRNISLVEIGNTISFLCSDMSSGVTGQTIYVDGGYSITEINR